jgi:hypothetical protein
MSYYAFKLKSPDSSEEEEKLKRKRGRPATDRNSRKTSIAEYKRRSRERLTEEGTVEVYHYLRPVKKSALIIVIGKSEDSMRAKKQGAAYSGPFIWCIFQLVSVQSANPNLLIRHEF